MEASYIDSLKIIFSENANPNNAIPMAKYMKNKFEFLGLKSPLRNELGKIFYTKHSLPEKNELESIVKALWELPQREFQYFAMEMIKKFIKKADRDIINTLEYMIITKSWWDTVDFIASNLVGILFEKYPEMIRAYTKKWMDSGNIWLQRTALLYQLKYKKNTNFELLTQFIHECASSKEFFIQKAIGWILREYSKTDAKAVIVFVENNNLAPLSKREALKWLKNKGKI